MIVNPRESLNKKVSNINSDLFEKRVNSNSNQTPREKGWFNLYVKKIDISAKANRSIKDNINKTFEDYRTYFRRTLDGNRVIVGRSLPKHQEQQLSSNTLWDTSKSNNKSVSVLNTKALKRRECVYGGNINLNNIHISHNIINSLKRQGSHLSKPSNPRASKVQNVYPLNESKNFIDDSEWNSMYDYYKTLKKENTNSSSRDTILSYQCNNNHKHLANVLNIQKNILRKKSKNNQYSKQIEKHLLKYSRKDNANKWLWNQINSFRVIREIKERSEEKNKSFEKNTLRWAINLRLGPNDKGINKAYVNWGSEQRPNWTVIYERLNREKEKIRNCDYINKSSINENSFWNNEYLREQKDFYKVKKSFEELEGLKIEGVSWLDNEISNTKQMKGRKWVTKFNYNEKENLPKVIAKSYSMKDIYNAKVVLSSMKIHDI